VRTFIICAIIMDKKTPHETTIKTYISLTSLLLISREAALATDNDIIDNSPVIIKVLTASFLETN
jgi:hypothetical protein